MGKKPLESKQDRPRSPEPKHPEIREPAENERQGPGSKQAEETHLGKKGKQEFLEKEDFLEEKEGSERSNWKSKKHQKKEKHLEDENTDEDEDTKYLPQESSSSTSRKRSMSFSELTALLESLPIESFYENVHPLLFLNSEEEIMKFIDKATQTEWLDDDPYGSVYTDVNKEEEEKFKSSISKKSLWGDILDFSLKGRELNETMDASQIFIKSILKEMTAEDDIEDDVDIPLTGHLESDTRRKLGILLKKNIEKYKEVITWILKKRENLLQKHAPNVLTFQLETPEPKPSSRLLPVRGHKGEVGKSHLKKLLEIDRYFSVENIAFGFQSLQDKGKEITYYPSETVFQISFPDGSGQLQYPSGNLALLIITTQQRRYTYIVLEDNEDACFRAFVNNTGDATFYNENREMWLNLSPNLGYYFPKGRYQKAWNWWNHKIHIHAPPFQSISLKINRYIKVKINSQDTIILRFTYGKKHIYFNLGTKFKFLSPGMLDEMKAMAILEVEVGSTAQKIQILLGKMSTLLKILSASDLEAFISMSNVLLMKCMANKPVETWVKLL